MIEIPSLSLAFNTQTNILKKPKKKINLTLLKLMVVYDLLVSSITYFTLITMTTMKKSRSSLRWWDKKIWKSLHCWISSSLTGKREVLLLQITFLMSATSLWWKWEVVSIRDDGRRGGKKIWKEKYNFSKWKNFRKK